jgi:hypothetical protein
MKIWPILNFVDCPMSGERGRKQSLFRTSCSEWSTGLKFVVRLAARRGTILLWIILRKWSEIYSGLANWRPRVIIKLWPINKKA